MNKHFLFTASLICLLSSFAFSQTRTAQPVKPAPKNAEVKASLDEIPQEQWNRLAAALRAENWQNAASTAMEYLLKLKTENEKKQVAQLNYIYLFALAGRTAQGGMPFEELEKMAQSFVGREFLMVSRQILADCEARLNYICAQKGSSRILRTTSTNRAGDAIHFFEYVKLKEPFDVPSNAEKIAFVGGTLSKVETVERKGIKALRLIFDNGYVRVTTD
jgi:hypothetical protein